MKRIQVSYRIVVLVGGVTLAGAFHLVADHARRAVPPDAVVDLCTIEGASRVSGKSPVLRKNWGQRKTRVSSDLRNPRFS